MAGSERHPATVGLLRWFEFEHLPPDLQPVSRIYWTAAHASVDTLRDGSELTTALRKLLEAKDCAVRQAIADRSAAKQSERPPTYGNPGGAAATVPRPPVDAATFARPDAKR